MGDNNLQKLKIKSGDAIHAVLFFTSLILTIWAINIYRSTIVELKYLLAIILGGIIIALIVMPFLLDSTYSFFWKLFMRSCVGGCLFYFGFLFLNQNYAAKDSEIQGFQIIKTGTLSSGKKRTCSRPYVVIDFNGIEKELVFNCEFSDAAKNSKVVILNYSKGLFGFAVIKSKQLSD